MLFKLQSLRVYLSFITYFGIRHPVDIPLPSAIIGKVPQNDNSSYNKDGLSNLASSILGRNENLNESQASLDAMPTSESAT